MTVDRDVMDSMLRYDPLKEAEKITGESYKKDGSTSKLGILLAMQHDNEMKRLFKSQNDTYHDITPLDAKKIISYLGFKLVAQRMFRRTDQKFHVDDVAQIYWNGKALVYLETLDRTSIKKLDLYYNWKARSEAVAFDSQFIGWIHQESYQDGECVVIGHHDVREGFKHIYYNLVENGSLMSQWIQCPDIYAKADIDEDDNVLLGDLTDDIKTSILMK